MHPILTERKHKKLLKKIDSIFSATLVMVSIVGVLCVSWFSYVVLWAAFTPMEEFGCALDDCPLVWQVKHYTNGGKKYYTDYPKDSFAYLNAYCTEAQGTLFACK